MLFQKTISFGWRAFVLTAALVMLGCGGENSDVPEHQGSSDTDTSNLEVHMRVTAVSDNSTHIEVQLFDSTDPHTAIYLEDGDSVEVNTAVDSAELTREATALIPTYEGTFSTGATGTLFTVSVSRTSPPNLESSWFPGEIVGAPELDNYYVSADSNMVKLPETFTIDTPSANEIFLPNSDVTISWTRYTASAVVTLLEWQSTCPEFDDDFQQEISGARTISALTDPGTFTLPIETLLEGQDLTKSDPCRIRIEVIREVNGTVDASLASTSYIVGAQQRAVSIRYFP